MKLFKNQKNNISDSNVFYEVEDSQNNIDGSSHTAILDNVYNYDNIENSNVPDDAHLLHLWEPLEFEIDEDYKFINNGFLFSIFSNLLYLIAYPILTIFNKLVFGFKVVGKENYKKVKGSKITVSNHVHAMDCTMIGTMTIPCKTYFTSLASNFKIPIVNTLIRLLNTIPIPTEISKKQDFKNAINTLLKDGKSIHFYPEGSLWPYYTKIRKFKRGAFHFAVDNNVPIVPCVFKFYEPTSLLKYFKKKPCISLNILEPIYPNTTLKNSDAVYELESRVREAMIKEIEM